MLRTLVAPVLALPLLVLAPSTPAHAVGTCNGLPATIESGGGVVSGTSGDDVIIATPTGATVAVDALAGNDTVCLAAGPASGVASIDAGAGNDTVLVTAAGGHSLSRCGRSSATGTTATRAPGRTSPTSCRPFQGRTP